MFDEIRAVPIIDTHCHHVNRDSGVLKGAERLAQLVNIGDPGGEEFPPAFTRSQMVFNRLIAELAAYLGCETGAEAVVAARNAAAVPYGQYIDRLWADAGIDLMLFDLGHPGPASYPHFAAMSHQKHRTILRIDTVMAGLAKEQLGFDEFLSRFDQAVEAGIAGGDVALKSYIAGKTGLRVEESSRLQAEVEYPRFIAGRGLDTKAFNDFMFARAADFAVTFDVPLQVHACPVGGATIMIDLVHPSLLQGFLKTHRSLRLVLVHGGFPWVEESAMLTIIFPRVWMDMSLFTSFLPQSSESALTRALTIAPPAKIMYASDGAIIPELHWLSARMGREAAARTLKHYLDAGFMTPATALDAARAMLSGNAREVYRI